MLLIDHQQQKSRKKVSAMYVCMYKRMLYVRHEANFQVTSFRRQSMID